MKLRMKMPGMAASVLALAMCFAAAQGAVSEGMADGSIPFAVGHSAGLDFCVNHLTADNLAKLEKIAPWLDAENLWQTAYRVCVGTALGKADLWDTGSRSDGTPRTGA